ncbi:C2H2 type zinc-finger-domain-containing protein [Epithele typhae]|uniref:C2H2 type zinc-finger-domain-containing protein n=1 Tax=Epithele typhae TaxID=378194 RepID=UPI00200847BE|nr:C2H2 type zinc-finger-domain-containing protein [Epithele typhae]KAH9942313.1 C2H2 type zinc-finger-domain-containing protein [Epithele typhae]
MMDVLPAQPEVHQNLYTCISCTIAFLTAQDQREHYRSDHHRYNMKRRVASLPPVSAALFNQKVLERRAETAVMASPKGSSCEPRRSTRKTSFAPRPRHRPPRPPPKTPAPSPWPVASQIQGVSLSVDADATEDEVNATIDSKIAAARAALLPTQCLFCAAPASESLDANLEHMSRAHGFFVPDADFLVDLVGLVGYLGEKTAVGNACVFCDAAFRTHDAVRRHMRDKGHCKIAYDTDEERLEVSDFYDFEASYPDMEERKARREARETRRAERQRRKDEKAAAKAEGAGDDATEEWEDDDGEGDVDEVVEEEASSTEDEDDSDEDEEDVPDNQVTYGDSSYELVLPSGARIGHRAMRRYYAQSFPGAPRGGRVEDPNSGAALVRRLIADKNSALVPVRGGFGAYGQGTQVVKARNAGEARHAGRHIREFRDQRRREEFRTKVGFIHNNQKHFRDPNMP